MAAFFGRSTERAGYNTVKWLTWNHHFKAWLRPIKSQLLLVKGCMSSEIVTPLSFSSATLLFSLHNDESTIPLYFFCGMVRSNATSGPHVLLRSLIAQFLLQHRCDTSVFTRQAVDQIASLESHHLWQLFATMMKSLRSTVVFCIIDGLAKYHSKPEAFFVLQGLQKLVEECTGDVVLKVLLTDPVPMETMDYIPQHDTLTIPSNP